MNWNSLSDEAKNVIEWVENPFTYKKEIVTINEGKYFVRDYQNNRPFGYISQFSNNNSNCKILITKPLYEEIKAYVGQDENLIMLENSLGFSFCLKNYIKDFSHYMNEPENEDYERE